MKLSIIRIKSNLLLWLLLYACSNTKSDPPGKALAARYCSSCHQLPDPSLLNARTWNDEVLPLMGPRLGMFSQGFKEYPSYRNDPQIDKSFYPSQPLLTSAQWKSIIEYYTTRAPDSLKEADQRQPIDSILSRFSIQPLPARFKGPATCMVRIDTTVQPHQLITSDLITHAMYRYNPQLRLIDSVVTRGPVVQVRRQNDQLLWCDIGELNPTNGKFGALADAHGPFIQSLARPVQFTPADLNVDGLTDYIICEFGNLTGCLSWYEQKPGHTFQRHVLRPFPGAVQTIVQDYNHDGLPDIWTLFAQGEEGIFLFTNKGNGRFTEQQVLQFPAAYGSTSFDMIDYNHDGRPDIIYTCGDNADYSRILKPYHGVYIFLNEGDLSFKQHTFFHINGCYKAIPCDYDKDGDIDIAAISFFADNARRPLEAFVYLDHANDTFTAHSFPLSTSGRWLVMDAGDLDGDGYIDLVLGNFSKGPAMIKSAVNWEAGPAGLLLLNKSRR